MEPKQEDTGHKLRAVLTDPVRARRLASHMWRHFKQDRCLDEAASLSYTSLLSLVPLLAVVFGIASSNEAFSVWSGKFKVFIFKNMVPTSSLQLQEHVDGFLTSVDKLTYTGAFFLILTALLLMMRIEQSFNMIWRVPVSRRFVNKLTMYWAVLTLGPLALGVATTLSAQPLLELLGADISASEWLRTIGIFMFTWGAFCMTFLLVPNTKVPILFAAFGSLVSTVLFSVSKVLFLVYINQASYSVIYGALATLPIFLLWLYLVWVVILLGASLAASLTTFSDRRTEWRWPPAWEFLLVFRLLGHFHKAQAEGRALSTEQLMVLEPGVPSVSLCAILVKLVEENLIAQDQEQSWVLKRDLDRYSLRDLYRAGEYHLPIGKDLPVPTKSPWDKGFLELINSDELNMDFSLTSLYEGAGEKGGKG